jgi:hypothetical protein
MKTRHSLPAAFAIPTMLFAFIALSACHNTLANVKTELAEAGYLLWYPAETGIKPGQIWQLQGHGKAIIYDQPPGLPLWGPQQVYFQVLKRQVNADISLGTDFAAGLFSAAGPLSASLKKSTVTSVALDFGRTEVERLILGMLEDAALLASLPEPYRKLLQEVRAGQNGYVLIGAVLSTAGMKYVFTCEDANGLAANASEIAKILKVGFDVKIVSKTEAVWEIPGTTRLAIGINPAWGVMLKMTPLQNIRALSPVLSDDAFRPAEFLTALEHQINTVLMTDKKSEETKKENIRR